MKKTLEPELEKLKALLSELVAVPSTTGYEEPMMRWCKDRFSPLTDQVEVDVRGNVYATFPATADNAPKLMLAAHMDACGLNVKYIRPDGFIRYGKYGTLAAMCSKRVWIHGANGAVLGIIGTHACERTGRIPVEEEMFVDIGCGSSDEVREAGIGIGDPITYEGELVALGNPYHLASHSLDDRAGIVCLMILAEGLKDMPERCEVVMVGTIEEEGGCRGAGTAAFRIGPDVAIAVDTQAAAGTPDLESKKERFPIETGKGMVIKFGDGSRPNHPRVRQLLTEAARRVDEPCQVVASGAGTDMGTIQVAGPGTCAASIGIPRRYSHTTNEVMDIRDLRGTIAILGESIRMLGSGYDLAVR